MTELNAPEELPPAIARAFAPVHKRAFGMAVGLVCGLLVFGTTAIYLLRNPQPGFNLGLFSEYLYGYTVSWQGALVGSAWGFVAGFVGGWFFAFCRNLFLATWLFVTRERAALAASRDFLDQI